MIKLDIKNAVKELNKIGGKNEGKLSDKQVADATRMALNEAARKGKTEVKNAILSVFNIKASRITNPDRRKGLSIKPATNKNLVAEIDAGHTPIQLSDTSIKFKSVTIAQGTGLKTKSGKVTKGKATKRSVSQITVEIKKGQAKTLATAFIPGSVTVGGTQMLSPLIFARGKKGKPTFQFGKSRYPIDTLSTISIATASTNVNAKDRYGPVVENYMVKRLEHHLQRQINKI